MLKKYLYCLVGLLLMVSLTGCEQEKAKPKIGVSFGVGGATRWEQEKTYMEEHAKELGAGIEVRINRGDTPKTQTQDCLEMIDNGIDVLILTPRNVRKIDEIVEYARHKKVKVISYARAAMGQNVDLYIGFDCYKIGQSMGQHLVEKIYRGNFVILKGDPDDFNTPLLYYGAMKYITPLVENGSIKIVMDEYVPGWSAEEAKRLLKEALTANNNQVDAILTPNDRLAEACAEVLKELNITTPVVISGMDAELSAIKRLVSGTQDMTVFLDLKNLAYAGVEEACNLASKKKVTINSFFDNESTQRIDAYLINGKVVTKENIDKVLLESGVFTREEVYSK